MNYSILFRNICLPVWVVVLVLGCGDDGGDDENTQPGLEGTVNFEGAYGVLVVDTDEGASLRLMEKHNAVAQLLGDQAPKFEWQDGMKLMGSSPATINGKPFTFPNRLKLQESSEETSGMQKIKSDGTIENAITYENTDWQPNLPEIQTIAVAPTGEVYLQFRHPFIYREADNRDNPWDMSSGYQCQIFRVAGGTLDQLQASGPQGANLECIDNQHFIDNWRTGSNEVFQFDSSGAIYYPGSIPDSNKMVVYKIPRNQATSEEIINAQICVQDFLITGLGGVFYTGNTCQDGDWSGTGFFRYVAPDDGGVIEIARDWWDFIFDTKVAENASGDSSDNAVFFGPDPRSASTASWESACLFYFNPSDDDPQTRVSNVITCGDNIWSWLWMERSVDIETYGRGLRWGNPSGTDLTKLGSWKQEFSRRCESDDEVFAGGGSQISSIKQDDNGQVFVIGNIRKKIAGSLTCNLEMRGPHCKIDGSPVLYSSQDLSGGNYASAKTDCTDNAGTWVDEGWCSNNSYVTALSCITNSATWYPSSNWYDNASGDICTVAENGDRSNWWSSNTEWDVDGELEQEFIVQNLNCEPVGSSGGGGDWTNEYKALAKVDNDKEALSLLSTETEQAIDVWIVNDAVYYSSFDATQGEYLLNTLSESPVCIDGSVSDEESCTYTWRNRRCVNTTLTTEATCLGSSGHYWIPYESSIILSNFETYNLAPSGSASELWADGLDFSDNSYKFGTVNLDTNELSLNTGLTGTLKTIVILSE